VIDIRSFITYLLIFILAITSGCSGKANSKDSINPNTTLKIGYISEGQFETRYSSLLAHWKNYRPGMDQSAPGRFNLLTAQKLSGFH
jgi:hypothetical protein